MRAVRASRFDRREALRPPPAARPSMLPGAQGSTLKRSFLATMTRQTLQTPLSILFVGLVMIIIMLFADSGAHPGAAPRQQTYPGVTETVDPVYPEPGTPTAPTPTTTQPTGTTSTPAPTRAAPAGSTSTPTAGTPQATSTPTSAPTARPAPTITPAPTAILPTATPTSELVCLPGAPTIITGAGPPRAGFLLLFDGRPVSGGTVEPDGRFSITLIVGNEAPGTYDVVVQVRGTRQVLREITCDVPATPNNVVFTR